MLGDADALNRTLLQAMSRGATAEHIDSEIGDLSSDLLTGAPLLTYLRYNVRLDASWLHKALGYAADHKLVSRLCALDNADAVTSLADLGRHAAARQVKDEHFSAPFDRARD